MKKSRMFQIFEHSNNISAAFFTHHQSFQLWATLSAHKAQRRSLFLQSQTFENDLPTTTFLIVAKCFLALGDCAGKRNSSARDLPRISHSSVQTQDRWEFRVNIYLTLRQVDNLHNIRTIFTCTPTISQCTDVAAVCERE